MIIKITEPSVGARLDKFLAQQRQDLSRNQIQKLIKQRVITVNGWLVAPHYNLKANDIINIREKLPEPKKTTKETGPKNLPDLKIIDETDEFLIINKPAGLAVHGAAGWTLADWLKAKYPDISRVGDPASAGERPGIVHRLDKDVSGLMVIAKTQAAFNDLKKQFQNRAITKEYTALVHGKIQKDADQINFPIGRARDGYKMAALPLTVKGKLSESGRPAETEFRIITRLINYTLLKIKIKTGRTHQIRVHLSAYGHPVVGDKIYGTAKTKNQNKKLGLSRIFLIADHLCFTDLTGKPRDFKVSLTEELKNILKQAR
jgi:23S rRNA pseudouridine1911/1915/1917 synthase